MGIRKIKMEGYKRLTTYILATVICDLNVEFIKSWISYKSRTRDQMEQAGRSGKQNIAEGYTIQSLKSYIKLLGVAVGSIKELSADYEDFLRQNQLAICGQKMMGELGFFGVLGRFG